MKFLLTASVLALSLSAVADMQSMKGKPLPEQKQMMNSKIDQKMESLQASKTCVSGAKDEKSLEKCMKDQKEAMEEVHESWMKEKEESMDSSKEGARKSSY